MSSKDVQSNAKCMELVERVMQFKRHMTERDPPLTICTNPVARPRLPNAIIFAIGGHNCHHPTRLTEVYDIRADCWTVMQDHQPQTLLNHGAVYYNGSIYCVGGCSYNNGTSSMYRFDLMTRTWHEAASMQWHRNDLTVTELNGCIYAIGGRDEMRSDLRTAERYKLETNQWSCIAIMHEPRADASSTALNNRVSEAGEQLEILLELKKCRQERLVHQLTCLC